MVLTNALIGTVSESFIGVVGVDRWGIVHPAFPFHSLIQPGNSNVEFFNVGVEDLTRRTVWVVETVFVAHPFACRTLNILKERSTVAVWTGQAAWIRRSVRSFPWGTWGIRVSTGPIFSFKFAAAIPLFETNALVIVPIDTEDGMNTLHYGAEASYAWGDDVTHTRLCILVDAGSQTVDA